MVIPAMTGTLAQDPYAPPPAREHAWRGPFPVGVSRRRPMLPAAAAAAASAFRPKEENPFRTGVDPGTPESAAAVHRTIWIQQLQNTILAGLAKPTQPATTWLASALEELEEIDREVLEDGLPTIKAETRYEAARILRELVRQTIQPTTYPTNDGEIVIHFQSRGVQAAVLIELSNDGQAACFSYVGGKNCRARYDDSSDLPDAFVMAQLKALARETGA